MHQQTVCNSHPHFYDLRECLFCRWKIRTSCNTSILYSLSWRVSGSGWVFVSASVKSDVLAGWVQTWRLGHCSFEWAKKRAVSLNCRRNREKFCNPVWKRKGSRFNWSWLCMRYSVVTGACSSTRAARSAHAVQRLFCCLSLHMAPICCLIRVGASLTPVNEMPKEASVRPLTSLSLVCLDHRDTSVWSRQ